MSRLAWRPWTIIVATHSIRHRILKVVPALATMCTQACCNPFDPTQDTERRMAQVESEMVFVDHGDEGEEPLYVPEGMSRAEAYRRLTGEDNEEESR